jgi:hypothetical protein
MSGLSRALTTLFAAAAGGFLLWLAAQFDMRTTGGYWAALGVVAGCGLLLGLGSLRGAGGNPPAMFLFGFLPVFVCASWVLLYAQPHSEWGRHLIRNWSGNMGIGDVVHDVSMWNGVVAFGMGLVFAYVLEPSMLFRRRTVADEVAPAPARPQLTAPAPAPVYDEELADEPTAAEREEAATTTAAPRRRLLGRRTTVRQ